MSQTAAVYAANCGAPGCADLGALSETPDPGRTFGVPPDSLGVFEAPGDACEGFVVPAESWGVYAA